MPLAAFKALVRDQFNMLLVDQKAALAAIPSMLPADAKTRRKGLDLITRILSARGGTRPAAEKERLHEIEQLFRVTRKPRRKASTASRASGNGRARRHRKNGAAPALHS